MSEIDSIIKTHFGTTLAACSQLGVTKAAISQWRKNGIPELRRYHIDAVISKQRKPRK